MLWLAAGLHWLSWRTEDAATACDDLARRWSPCAEATEGQLEELRHDIEADPYLIGLGREREL